MLNKLFSRPSSNSNVRTIPYNYNVQNVKGVDSSSFLQKNKLKCLARSCKRYSKLNLSLSFKKKNTLRSSKTGSMDTTYTAWIKLDACV